MKNLFRIILVLLIAVGCQSQRKSEMEDDKLTLMVGTYTKKEGHVDGKASGIYVYEMDKKTGQLEFKTASDRLVNPSYLTVHPNGKWVFAVNEFEGLSGGMATLTALNYDAGEDIMKIVNQVNSLGYYPCHISLDRTGEFVMAANYVGGSVALFSIDDGELTEADSYKKHEGKSDHPRQEDAHAHMIVQHPELSVVYAVDLGANKVYTYELDSESRTLNYLDELEMAPEAGPRHMTFHPKLNKAYVLNELNGTVQTLNIDDSGMLSLGEVVSTMEPGDERDPANSAIKIHPSGKYLYTANRGELNEIVLFEVNETGQLTRKAAYSTKGKTPRDFSIDPSGQFLLAANQDSDSIIIFQINQLTGQLQELHLIENVLTPVCLEFLD